MKILSIKVFRFLSVATVAIVLILGVSCKKEDTSPNSENNSGPSNNNNGNNNTLQPLIATADINFVDEGKTVDFESHNIPDFTEFGYIFIDDSIYVFAFKSSNKYGVEDESPLVVQFTITEPEEGQVYTLDNAVGQVRLVDDNHLFEDNPSSTASIQFNSLQEDDIQGTFEFTAVSQNDPTGEKVIVSNGQFEGTLGSDN